MPFLAIFKAWPEFIFFLCETEKYKCRNQEQNSYRVFKANWMVENNIAAGDFKVAFPELIQRHVLEHASSAEILAFANEEEPYPEINATLG